MPWRLIYHIFAFELLVVVLQPFQVSTSYAVVGTWWRSEAGLDDMELDLDDGSVTPLV